jgi:hypothetical protein
MFPVPFDPADEQPLLRRRSLILKGLTAGGLVWAAPVIQSVTSVAAAASGPRTATASLFKSGNGSANPPLVDLCQLGATSTAGRGTAVFTRTDNPPTICVTVTLSTGADAQTREIFILQSTGGATCVGGDVTPVGTWAPVPPAGPQTFCAPIASGATRFVVAQQLSGGQGNDGWASSPPVALE